MRLPPAQAPNPNFAFSFSLWPSLIHPLCDLRLLRPRPAHPKIAPPCRSAFHGRLNIPPTRIALVSCSAILILHGSRTINLNKQISLVSRPRPLIFGPEAATHLDRRRIIMVADLTVKREITGMIAQCRH